MRLGEKYAVSGMLMKEELECKTMERKQKPTELEFFMPTKSH